MFWVTAMDFRWIVFDYYELWTVYQSFSRLQNWIAAKFLEIGTSPLLLKLWKNGCQTKRCYFTMMWRVANLCNVISHWAFLREPVWSWFFHSKNEFRMLVADEHFRNFFANNFEIPKSADFSDQHNILNINGNKSSKRIFSTLFPLGLDTHVFHCYIYTRFQLRRRRRIQDCSDFEINTISFTNTFARFAWYDNTSPVGIVRLRNDISYIFLLRAVGRVLCKESKLIQVKLLIYQELSAQFLS